MAKLRLHHTYARGAAVDVSDNGNHGEVTDAYPTGSDSVLSFDSPSSRVQVPPSDSLQRLRSIRARVRFRLDPEASPERRYNLMEGHLSFALYVTPGFELKGTIYDAEKNWRGATSDERAVEPGRWHTAELTYVDSAARVDLRLDGEVVGSEEGVAGPVRPVGELGLSIGIWPDADRYALDGRLDEAKLWATWPEFEDFVDPCCSDMGSLDRVLDIMRRDPAVQNREVDPTEILRGLQTISGRVRAKIVDGDPDRADTLRQLEAAFEEAYRDRDLKRILTTFAKGYRLMASANVSSTAMVDEGREGIELLRRVELGRRLLDPFIETGNDATTGTVTGGGWGIASGGISHRMRPDRIPDPPEEVRQLVGAGARSLCLPAPTDDDGSLPSTEPDDHWGEIPHEPWPKRPDHDPEEIERKRKRERKRREDRDADADTDADDESESNPRERPERDMAKEGSDPTETKQRGPRETTREGRRFDPRQFDLGPTAGEESPDPDDTDEGEESDCGGEVGDGEGGDER